MVRIAVTGCAGRMGRMLLREVLATDGCELTAGSVIRGSAEEGKDLGSLAGSSPIGIKAVSGIEPLLEDADVVIDFTTPELTIDLARGCAAHNKALVTGTTGLSDSQQSELEELANHICIVQAGNMSVGVNLMLGLVEQTAARLDNGYDIEIMEMHHRHKKDAPSGTALMLGRAAATGRGISLPDVERMSRAGDIGERPCGEIGFAALRGGDVVGEHKVIFAGDGEMIEITHRAGDRRIFARGAIQAALWTQNKPSGLYDMRKILAI